MTSRAAGEPRQISIAIVDDDASVRVSLQRLCEVSGMNATVYASGREFLSSLGGDADAVDCLLLDAHMPGMTGSELHDHLVARGERIPTIVFTGDDTLDVSAHYGGPAIVEFLRKPVSREHLLAAVERAVQVKG
jgi:FixJ family two-component response regulator